MCTSPLARACSSEVFNGADIRGAVFAWPRPMQSGALDQTDREVQHDSRGVHTLSGWIMGRTRFFASASTMATWAGGRPVNSRKPTFRTSIRKVTQEAPRTLGVEPMARCRTPGSRRPRRFREAPQDMGTGSDDDDAETGMRFQCPATA